MICIINNYVNIISTMVHQSTPLRIIYTRPLISKLITIMMKSVNFF